MTSCTAFKPPFTNCACNDMVLIRSVDGTNYIAGQILSLFAIDSIGTFCLVNMFEFAGQDADFHSHWRNANQHMIINVSSLLASTVWTKLRDARFRLLTPLQFRGAKAVATWTHGWYRRNCPENKKYVSKKIIMNMLLFALFVNEWVGILFYFKYDIYCSTYIGTV